MIVANSQSKLFILKCRAVRDTISLILFQFFLHVGVSSEASNVVLEQIACCGGYKKPDVFNKLPQTESFRSESSPAPVENLSMCTAFDLEMCKAQLHAIGVPASTSSEAGRSVELTRKFSLNGSTVQFPPN